MLRTICLLILSLAGPALAAEEYVGRYTITETTATSEQRFPLIQVKSLTIPRSILTNQQAVDFVLRNTGYQVATSRVRTPEDLLLMRKSLADVSRHYTNTSLLEMLNSIAGLGFTPVVDPINRLVAFEAIYDFVQ